MQTGNGVDIGQIMADFNFEERINWSALMNTLLEIGLILFLAWSA